jgi:acyl dehydratase
MPLNPTFAKRVYPATRPYQVGREKIREFAAAIGDDNPACHDLDAARARGHADVVASPTFAIALTMQAEGQVMFDPELGLDLARVLHREQAFDHRRPLRAGDEVTVTVSVAAIDEVGGHDLLTLVSDVRTVQGEQVCTATSTLVARAAVGLLDA